MNYKIEKYSLSFLLAFLMLVAVSCHKGDEPIPYGETSSVSSDNYSSQRVGDDDTDGGKDSGSNQESGNSDDGPGVGGSGDDGGTVIGGDDNEDDDDGDNTVGSGPGDGFGGTNIDDSANGGGN